jgi:hypothetical protein
VPVKANEGKLKGLAITQADRVQLSMQANEGKRKILWGDHDRSVDRGTTRRAVAMRMVPVPRSEPPSDEELGATGHQAPPLTAVPLPLDLATGRRYGGVGGRWRPERRSSG